MMPNRRTENVTSVVMMGRSMKIRERCMMLAPTRILEPGALTLCGRHNFHMGTREEHHLPIGNDCFSRLDTRVDQHFVLDGTCDRHHTRLHCFVLLHNVNELALLAGLDRLSRYHGRI